MKNTINKWFYPKINKSAVNNINRIINNSYVNEGPFGKKFENKISKICDRKYCAITSSGSTALVTALLAVGVKKNDKIFLPGFSFIATANAVKIIEAKPIWIDVDINNMCISHVDLLKKIKSTKKIPKYLISVEVNGYAPDYKKIKSICKKYNIILITDSAESFGSSYYSRKLGGIGLVSILSFSPNKVITTGQGGAVLTNSKKIYKKILAIKFQGNDKRGDGGSDRYYMKGLNFKLSDINSIIGLTQLNEIKKRLSNTKKNYLIYKKLIENKDVFFPNIQPGGKRLWVDCIARNRKNFIKFLKSKNVAFRKFWLPMNEQKSMSSKTVLKNTKYLSKNGIWLSSNFDLTVKMINEKFKK
jgi:perosamine synthetase